VGVQTQEFTPDYTDWETRMTGKANQANDVWALGLTLFESMYGEKANPFHVGGLGIMSEEAFNAAHAKLLKTMANDHSPQANVIRKMLVLKAEERPKLTDPAFQREFESASKALEAEAATPLIPS
jgi:hypothetical protein